MFFAESLNVEASLLCEFTESLRHILSAVLGKEMTLLRSFDELDPLYFKLLLLLPEDPDRELIMDFLLTLLGILGASNAILSRIDIEKVILIRAKHFSDHLMSGSFIREVQIY